MTQENLTTSGIEHPCIKELMDHRFVTRGSLVDMKTGGWNTAPIIYQLTEGKTGKIYRSSNDLWMVLQYCPVCGAFIGEHRDTIQD